MGILGIYCQHCANMKKGQRGRHRLQYSIFPDINPLKNSGKPDRGLHSRTKDKNNDSKAVPSS